EVAVAAQVAHRLLGAPLRLVDLVVGHASPPGGRSGDTRVAPPTQQRYPPPPGRRPALRGNRRRRARPPPVVYGMPRTVVSRPDRVDTNARRANRVRPDTTAAPTADGRRGPVRAAALPRRPAAAVPAAAEAGRVRPGDGDRP